MPIVSRPVYGTLNPSRGARHIVIADVAGATAILDMAPRCPPGFFAAASLLLVTPDPSAIADRLRRLHPNLLAEDATLDAALLRLAHILATAAMGTQLYAAGSEGLIGQAIRTGMAAGLERAAIVTEHRGSAARRVQCVHCKAIMDGVTTQPVRCPQCGLALLVRDHYSHRIAAFQGVCIDAEQPGTAPPPEQAFP